jgi:F-box interacting protein
MYGFGYDPISDNYKVVVVFSDLTHDDLSIDELMNEVMREVRVYILGTNSWKNVSEFPFAIVSVQHLGQHVNDTINWLGFAGIKRFIASFDLGNETYQEVLLPDDSGEVDENTLRLSVFRDYLCIIFGEDVWVMKEYGNKESWTKLFTMSYMRDPRTSSYPYIKAIRVFEDGQVLLMYREGRKWGHISYNCKNDTSKFIEVENTPEVCIESLLSPCF